MKIYIASDHAGFELKKKLVEFLKSQNYQVEDLGPFEFDPDDDYPDFINPLAQRVSENPKNLGIVIGGDGEGEVIVANKIKGIRAVLFYGPVLPKREVDVTGRTSSDPYEIVKLTRSHNNANVLSLGARFLTEDEAIEAVKLWLETKFSQEERHVRRIQKISQLEAKR